MAVYFEQMSWTQMLYGCGSCPKGGLPVKELRVCPLHFNNRSDTTSIRIEEIHFKVFPHILCANCYIEKHLKCSQNGSFPMSMATVMSKIYGSHHQQHFLEFSKDVMESRDGVKEKFFSAIMEAQRLMNQVSDSSTCQKYEKQLEEYNAFLRDFDDILTDHSNAMDEIKSRIEDLLGKKNAVFEMNTTPQEIPSPSNNAYEFVQSPQIPSQSPQSPPEFEVDVDFLGGLHCNSGGWIN